VLGRYLHHFVTEHYRQKDFNLSQLLASTSPDCYQALRSYLYSEDHMRIAALDVGSRSFHVLVASLQGKGGFTPIASQKEVVRLGEGLSLGEPLSEEKMFTAAGALSRLRLFAREQGATTLLAYGTSAVREAKNGGQFLSRMKAAAGVEITPISEHEEARLVHLALCAQLPKKKLSCIVEIGGNSVELLLSSADTIYQSISLPLGVQKLAHRYPSHIGLSTDARRRLSLELHHSLEPFAEAAREKGASGLFISGGSARALIGAAGALSSTLSFEALLDLEERLSSLPVSGLTAIPTLASDRAETAAVSAVLVRVLFEMLGVDTAQVCQPGLREGMILDYQQRFGGAVVVGGAL
jgi:exopolyphosphatase / guanosine-5'-triphosphate,3'-diphosphate pyrophosphatase